MIVVIWRYILYCLEFLRENNRDHVDNFHITVYFDIFYVEVNEYDDLDRSYMKSVTRQSIIVFQF